MNTKAEAISRKKQWILNDIHRAVFSRLFDDGYTDCLEKLVGKEIPLPNGFFVISKSEGDWTIEYKGPFSWMVKFGRNKCYDGTQDNFVDRLTIQYNEHLVTAPLLADMLTVVSELLCTYDSEGNKIVYPTE
jgi:hypothetical protein